MRVFVVAGRSAASTPADTSAPIAASTVLRRSPSASAPTAPATQTALLLALLNDGTREWRDELGDVTPDALLYQPEPNGHSIGAVLLHIADVEGFWLYDTATGDGRTLEELQTLLSKETNQNAGVWPAPPPHPLAWYYEQQDAARRRTLETWQTITDLSATRTAQNETQSEAFTLRWLLAHVIAHESYHGGQAVLLHELYKRRNNG